MSSTKSELDKSANHPLDETPKDAALDRCDEQIRWYSKAMRRSGLYYRTSQGLAIFLGGMTPVLVVLLAIFDDYQNLLLVLIALFPALAAVSAGLNGIFQYKETYIRFGYTAELLKSERIKFATRTTRHYRKKLTDEAVLNNFVRRVEAIALNEIADWRAQLNEALELDEALNLVEETRTSLSKN